MTVKPEVEADAAPTPMKEGQCECVEICPVTRLSLIRHWPPDLPQPITVGVRGPGVDSQTSIGRGCH